MENGETYWQVTVWENRTTRLESFRDNRQARDYYHRKRNSGLPVRLETVVCVMEANRD